MKQCPRCQQRETLCEQVNVEKGEVIGYICNQCAYEQWEDQE